MRDLSEQGFSLRAMMPVSPSEKVPFSFVLDSSAHVDGEAIVLRVEDGGHVAALEFAGLPPHSRDQIRRWLEKFDEPISPDPSPVRSPALKHPTFTELRSQIYAPEESSSASPEEESGPSPLQISAEATLPEPPDAPESPTAENGPQAPIVEAPPIPEQLISPEEMASPPAFSQSAIEQPDTPSLPPLLKLSSVRPGPPSSNISVEADVPEANPKPIQEPPAKIPITLPKAEAQPAEETRISAPVPPPPVAAARKQPPALEPLSSFEGEADSDSPSRMDRFTLSRAIGIMLLLTLAAGSYVYHREVGQALIWLGHQMAGDEVTDSSKVVRHETSVVSQAMPESTPPARAVPPPPLTVQPAQGTSEPRSASLPGATDKTPSPQLKDTTPGSLAPLTQSSRLPAPAAASGNTVDAGQAEYLEALQILRSPSRAAELPAAIQLFWSAVEKGNTAAEIDLAELFRTGRGVAKNCDQTRILLSAAVRKGSVEARKRLEQVQREGCND